MKPSRNTLFFTLLTSAVFITGFAALLYQVVWQRLLGLFSGSDVRSVTIVTSAFLAGLGIGSFIGSFFADRLTSRQAVRVYAACNLGIGIFALLSRYLYYDVLFLRWQNLAESPFLLLLVVFLSLLIPTTLMGLSLPLLSKAVVRSVENAPRLITWLYGFNTLGAGAGTIIAGWYLIGTYGYENCLRLGGGLSIGVGLLAWGLSFLFSTEQIGAEKTVPVLRLKAVPRSVWGWCALVFTSGFIAISLEIIWFRILDVVLKSNAYTFALLLAFFLVGDALGSLVGSSVVHRIHQPRRAFLWLQGGIALYSILITWFIAQNTDTYPLFDYIREAGTRLELTLEGNKLQWVVYLGLPALLMLPPSFLIGFYFPIVQKAIQTDMAAVGQRVGLVEVSNIAGNTLGGILTGVVMLHFLGTALALQLIALLGLSFMGVLLWENLPQWHWRERVTGLGLASALAVVILIFPSNARLWYLLHAIQTDEKFYVAEDSSGVSAVLVKAGQGMIYANGRFQGAIPYGETHSFLGALPALVHPDPQNILIIGIGSAGTPYAAGLNPNTSTILAVEIVGSEIDALQAYAAAENIIGLHHFFADPRYNIVLGDGRRELVFSDQPFDIIEADAILPISSHSGLLYSQEYFQAAYDQLAEDGIMAQWSPTPRVEATFMAVFPYGMVFDEVYLLGSKQPIPFNLSTVLARLDEPAVLAYLEVGGVDVAAIRRELGALTRTWTPQTRPPAADLNTDLFPRDEYYLNN